MLLGAQARAMLTGCGLAQIAAWASMQQLAQRSMQTQRSARSASSSGN